MKKAVLVVIETIIGLVLASVYVGVVVSHYSSTGVLDFFPDVQLFWPVGVALVLAGIAALVYGSMHQLSRTELATKEVEKPAPATPAPSLRSTPVPSHQAAKVLGTTASGQVVTKGPGIGNYRQTPAEQFGALRSRGAARLKIERQRAARERRVDGQVSRIRYAYSRSEGGRTPIVNHADEVVGTVTATGRSGAYRVEYRGEVLLEIENLDKALLVVRQRERDRLLRG